MFAYVILFGIIAATCFSFSHLQCQPCLRLLACLAFDLHVDEASGTIQHVSLNSYI